MLSFGLSTYYYSKLGHLINLELYISDISWTLCKQMVLTWFKKFFIQNIKKKKTTEIFFVKKNNVSSLESVSSTATNRLIIIKTA